MSPKSHDISRLPIRVVIPSHAIARAARSPLWRAPVVSLLGRWIEISARVGRSDSRNSAGASAHR